MDTLSKELAKQEMKLMYDTSARRFTDLYHDPRGYYAADVLHNAIQTRTGLARNQWDGREPSVDPETLAKIFLIGAGDHWTVIVEECNGHWVHKDDSRTIPVVNLHNSSVENPKHDRCTILVTWTTKQYTTELPNCVHKKGTGQQILLQSPTKI